MLPGRFPVHNSKVHAEKGGLLKPSTCWKEYQHVDHSRWSQGSLFCKMNGLMHRLKIDNKNANTVVSFRATSKWCCQSGWRFWVAWADTANVTISPNHCRTDAFLKADIYPRIWERHAHQTHTGQCRLTSSWHCWHHITLWVTMLDKSIGMQIWAFWQKKGSFVWLGEDGSGHTGDTQRGVAQKWDLWVNTNFIIPGCHESTSEQNRDELS